MIAVKSTICGALTTIIKLKEIVLTRGNIFISIAKKKVVEKSLLLAKKIGVILL